MFFTKTAEFVKKKKKKKKKTVKSVKKKKKKKKTVKSVKKKNNVEMLQLIRLKDLE